MFRKLSLFCVVISSLSFASSNLHYSLSNSQQGRTAINGSLGGGYATGGVGISSIGELTIAHYLVDNLAVTLNFTGYGNTSMKYFSLWGGPGLQYNFWHLDAVTAYSKIEVLRDLYSTGSSAPNYWYLRAQMGVDYFITSNLSLGPYVTNHISLSSPLSFSWGYGGQLGFHF